MRFLASVGTVQGRGEADGGWSTKRSTDVVRQHQTHDRRGTCGSVALNMWRRQMTVVDGDRQRQRVDSRPSSTVGLARATLWTLAQPAWTELVGELEASAAAGEQAICVRAVERRWSDVQRRSGPLEAAALCRGWLLETSPVLACHSTKYYSIWINNWIWMYSCVSRTSPPPLKASLR